MAAPAPVVVPTAAASRPFELPPLYSTSSVRRGICWPSARPNSTSSSPRREVPLALPALMASVTRPSIVWPRWAMTKPSAMMGWVRVPLKRSPVWLRSLESGWSTRILIQAPAGRTSCEATGRSTGGACICCCWFGGGASARRQPPAGAVRCCWEGWGSSAATGVGAEGGSGACCAEAEAASRAAVVMVCKICRFMEGAPALVRAIGGPKRKVLMEKGVRRGGREARLVVGQQGGFFRPPVAVTKENGRRPLEAPAEWVVTGFV